jgi:Sigma-70, region 4
MSPLDDLTPDLRAALSLVVDRGKSYAEVADLLGIPETAVRERAHAALDALAGGTVAGASSGGSVAGASSVEPAAESFQTGGPRARARTRAGTPKTNTPRTRAAGTPSPASPSPGSPSAATRSSAGSAAAPSALPVSRRGGAILLAGILAVIVVVVILVTSSGGSSSHNSAGSGAGGSSSSVQTTTGTTGTTTGTTGTGTTGTTGTASAKSPKITKQITLTPPESSSKSIGLVEVLAEGSQHAFYIAAEKLAPSSGFFYVVWLYDSPTKAEAISKAPSVGSDGRLQGGALLPTNAHEFDKVLLTKETNEHATTPGPVVLSGAFSLGH